MPPSPNSKPNAPPDKSVARQQVSALHCAVRGAADPLLLPRVFASFSRRGITPTSARADLTPDGREMVVDVWLSGVAHDVAARLQRYLPHLQGVSSVRMSERSAPGVRLVQGFADEQIAQVESNIASRLSSYEFLVSTGRIERGDAMREFRHLTALREALREFREADRP